jgi:hypothetical protein
MNSNILVKSQIPLLVEKGVLKHIAKINNIDINTGNVIPGPPTEFQLLIYEIKDSTLKCIRNNWLFFVILLIVIFYLYNRYHEVKRRKKLKLQIT